MVLHEKSMWKLTSLADASFFFKLNYSFPKLNLSAVVGREKKMQSFLLITPSMNTLIFAIKKSFNHY